MSAPQAHGAADASPWSNQAPAFEHAIAYGLVAMMGVVAARAVALWVVGRLDAAAQAAGGATRPGKLRTTAVSEDLDLRELAVGRLPSHELFAHVAYLRGGDRAVAEALVARSRAEGWLVDVAEDRFRIGDPGKRASTLTRELAAELRVTELGTDAVLAAALAVARRHTEGLERDLLTTGYLRGSGARTVGGAVAALIGAVVAIPGIVRTLADLEAARPPLAAGVALLVLGGVGLAAQIGRRTEQGDAYVAWLVESTVALRQDVARGVLTEPADVALAAAVEG